MSRIDDLIARVCPDGVELEPLGDVGQFVRGNGLQKKDFVEEASAASTTARSGSGAGSAPAAVRSLPRLSPLVRVERESQVGDLGP